MTELASDMDYVLWPGVGAEEHFPVEALDQSEAGKFGQTPVAGLGLPAPVSDPDLLG